MVLKRTAQWPGRSPAKQGNNDNVAGLAAPEPGRASASRHQLHDPGWVDAIDLATTTPNLSGHVRAFPNIEYYDPWFRSEGIHRCMPYEQWQRLSDHGTRICRYVACGPGEHVLGASFVHRQQFDELQAVGSHQAQDWWLRR